MVKSSHNKFQISFKKKNVIYQLNLKTFSLSLFFFFLSSPVNLQNFYLKIPQNGNLEEAAKRSIVKLPASLLIFWSVICHLAFGCCWDIWRCSRVFENRQFTRIDFQSKESHLLYWEPLMELWVLIFYHSVTVPTCKTKTKTKKHLLIQL